MNFTRWGGSEGSRGGGFGNGHPEGVRNESQRSDCSTASERLNLNTVAEVESRAELVRAMPRCSDVSVANTVQAQRSAVQEATLSQRLEETRHRDNLVVYIRAHNI